MNPKQNPLIPPMIQHQMLMMEGISTFGALQHWNPASSAWSPHSSRSATPPDATSLYALGAERITALQQGIARYHADIAAFTPLSPPAPPLWQQESLSLYRYGAQGRHAMFWVPSLINRSYILDLTEEYSILRYLAGQGIESYLLDWGTPSEDQQRFTLDDYIACAIGALEKTVALRGEKVILSGYCMGAIIALSIATLRPDLVSRIVLIAPPYDFHHGAAQGFRHHPELFSYFLPLLESPGLFDPLWMQQLFYFVHPFGINAKYIRFAGMDKDTPAYRQFLAVEHWVHDGVPLPSAVARACVIDWLRDNQLVRGQWKIGGRLFTPESLTQPTLSILATHDRIVPEASSLPLLQALPQNESYYVDTGHVSLMAGKKAKEGFWQPLVLWVGA